MTSGEQIDRLGEELEIAANDILAAAERGLEALHAARAGSPEAFEQLEDALLAVLQGCAFQDLAGQRLAEVRSLLAGARPKDPLLNGPALTGGLDQDAADALMRGD